MQKRVVLISSKKEFTWPVNVCTEVARQPLQPVHLLHQLFDRDSLSTLHEYSGHQGPGCYHHVLQLFVDDVVCQLSRQRSFFFSQVVDVPGEAMTNYFE